MPYVRDTRIATIINLFTISDARERVFASANGELAVTSDLLASSLALNTTKFYANF